MVTIGVIGCGRIAKNQHFPSLGKVEGVRVKYACDVLINKALEMQKEHSFIEQVVEDYNVILNDKEVDAVYVLTPNYLHYTITMDALRAGKHVFCEKPITVDYEKSVEMAEMAKKCNKILAIGVVNRFNTSIEMLKEMNEQGKFGKIYHVYCSFRSFRSIPGLGGAFTDKKQSGGGVLIDWGIHFFDLILYILGGAKLKNVTCDAYCETAKDMKAYKYLSMWAEDTKDVENGTNDVDDFISGYVRTDKANISFNGAWAQNIKCNEMFIDFLGDKGGARLDYGGRFKFLNADTLEEEAPEYDMPSMFVKENQAFIDSVASGEKPINYIDSVLESMKLLDALYKSSDASKEIDMQ